MGISKEMYRVRHLPSDETPFGLSTRLLQRGIRVTIPQQRPRFYYLLSLPKGVSAAEGAFKKTKSWKSKNNGFYGY